MRHVVLCNFITRKTKLCFSKKIYNFCFYRDMVCSVAGITSDANVLTNELRLIAQRYNLQYGEPMPCEQLVSWLCNIKQAYTQYGGVLINSCSSASFII